MSESVLAVCAAVWGVAMGLSPLLQVRQMLRTRSSRDVSMPYFLVLNVGFLLWFMYGLASSNLTVALPNVVAFAIGTLTIVVAWRLRDAVERPGSEPRAVLVLPIVESARGSRAGRP
ncbi:MAG: SemiSWEET family transporter [Ilumatobacteraceae bacterium]